MAAVDIVRWVSAAILWGLFVALLYQNIWRQFENQRRKRNGDNSHISGTPFIGTFLFIAAISASPLNFHWWYWLVLLLEIFALADFVAETH